MCNYKNIMENGTIIPIRWFKPQLYTQVIVSKQKKLIEMHNTIKNYDWIRLPLYAKETFSYIP